DDIRKHNSAVSAGGEWRGRSSAPVEDRRGGRARKAAERADCEQSGWGQPNVPAPYWLSNPASEHRYPLTEPRPRAFRVSNLLGDPARRDQSRCGPHESRYGHKLPFERVRIPLLIRFGLANQPRRDQKYLCPKPSTETVLRSSAVRKHKRL